jgi:hypothetical protein
MDLITRVIITDSQGEIIMDALVNSIKHKNELIRIAAHKLLTLGAISSVVRSGGYPGIQNTKNPIYLLPNKTPQNSNY